MIAGQRNCRRKAHHHVTLPGPKLCAATRCTGRGSVTARPTCSRVSTATAGDILAIRIIQTNIKKLVEHSTK